MISNSNECTLQIVNDQMLSLRIDNFQSEKELKKFIQSVERSVRSSIEYKQWKQYIIEVLGLDHCVITNEICEECTIEVHHHVPSLYILVKGVINNYIDRKLQFSTFDIALKVMELHFQNRVGYITLLKSIHEKFHNGYLDIPIHCVSGDYKSFLAEYENNLDDEDKDIIHKRLSIKETNQQWSKNNYNIGGIL